MASLLTNNHITNSQCYKDCKYLFAYYSTENKIWSVQSRRFILTTTNDTLHAQFLQSLWFNVTYKKNQTPIFVVLRVHKSISCSTIEKDMNSLKNPFPTVYDIPPYIKRHSYFNIPWNFNIRYVFDFRNAPNDEKQITQSLQFGGDFKMTDKGLDCTDCIEEPII